MHTEETFLARFEDFETAPDGLVLQVLTEQAENVSDGWGNRENEYHGLLTARALALSPFGRSAALVNPRDGSTEYDKRIDELQQVYACGRMRAV